MSFPRHNAWRWWNARRKLRPAEPKAQCPRCKRFFRVPIRRREQRRFYLHTYGYPWVECTDCIQAKGAAASPNPERRAQ